jgi:signal transduction histidine kinase
VKPSIRLRLTALYVALLLATTVVLLALSYWLTARHLGRTAPPDVADDVLGGLLAQYGAGLAGTGLLAVALGWIFAGRMLAPVRRMTATAKRVSQERLDERIALDGPRDELRELADTLDGMLDRLQGAVDAERRFVANASHELRSPLTVIRTEAEVTLSDPSATVADLRAMGNVVIEATDRTEALLEGLLTLARSQRRLERHEPIDLAQLVWRVANDLEREAAQARVEVTVHGEATVVFGNPQLIERLVANLAENAVRHNHPGGFASLHVERRGPHAVLEVANTGRVVSPEAIARLTEPFERLHRDADDTGTGLGLSIVRAVCETHGATLALRARAGGGLVAEVRLPAASVVAAASGSPVLIGT